jgi:membrane-bound lytic murein transglycosylase D
VGQDLMLPISAMAKVNPPTPSGTAKAVRAAAKTGQPIIHKVGPGDTLTSIARRYNVLVHQLAEWNVMQPNDVLQLGRKLKIFAHESPQADSRSSTASTSYA